ncbi:MAG: hypothetical protein R3D25_20110 [Geminicoccaceae bacterium]
MPAMNLRGWTYQTCRAVFQAARELDAQLFIFEQAVKGSVRRADAAEIHRRRAGAALREARGAGLPSRPTTARSTPPPPPRTPPRKARQLEKIIEEQIAAGFYNIDIDASTVVCRWPPWRTSSAPMPS